MADLRKKDDGNSIEERARKIFPSGGFGNLKADLVIESGSGGRVRDHRREEPRNGQGHRDHRRRVRPRGARQGAQEGNRVP